MTIRLKWPLMVLLVVASIIFTAPVRGQSPLDTLQTHDVSTADTAQTTSVKPSPGAGSGSGASVSNSVFESFLERINQLFSKLNSLSARVNELMNRLAKANEKKAVPSNTTSVAANSTGSGSSKNGSSNENSGSASGVAAKIGAVAAQYPSRYSTAQSFKYAPGTENGNLGCANVVSACLKEAGVPVGIILGVQSVKSTLLGLKAPNNWKKVSPPPYQPGDVVIWSPPSGGKHGHIGIVAKNGNSLKAMNNSSSKRHPVFSDIEYRAIECVLRKV